MAAGKVYLVGAGPGDKGLLTQRGAALLAAAQTVVYDRLVGADILAMIPAGAKRIDVGKRAGDHPVPQWRINQILVEQAQNGGPVVRLKGGDSFVFGRGGEELEALREAGIAFEVVPGITSAIAAATYAGIPVTHRDFCSSLHIITGHRRQDQQLQLDYPALVRLGGTLLFLMSVASAGEIAEGLLRAGMDPQMPAAVVENGTRPQQRRFVTALCRLKDTVQKNAVQSPALIIVGRVCALADEFDWFDALPLKGRRFLVTRSRDGAQKMADGLRQLGADVVCAPTIETRPLEFLWPDLSRYTALVFTSAVGVEAFMERLWQQRQDARALFGRRLFAVGRQTAAALRPYGLRADFVPSRYSGQDLAKQLLEQRLVGPEDDLLLIQARVAAPQLGQVLTAAGIAHKKLDVYETVQLPVTGVDPAAFDAVTFTSASCVRGLMATLGDTYDCRAIRALCIGPQTARAAAACGMRVEVSPEATIPAMLRWMGELAYDERT